MRGGTLADWQAGWQIDRRAALRGRIDWLVVFMMNRRTKGRELSSGLDVPGPTCSEER